MKIIKLEQILTDEQLIQATRLNAMEITDLIVKPNLEKIDLITNERNNPYTLGKVIFNAIQRKLQTEIAVPDPL